MEDVKTKTDTEIRKTSNSSLEDVGFGEGERINGSMPEMNSTSISDTTRIGFYHGRFFMTFG